MLDEKIEELWARTRKLMEEGTLEEQLPEQMDFFARQILVLATPLIRLWNQAAPAQGEVSGSVQARRGCVP